MIQTAIVFLAAATIPCLIGWSIRKILKWHSVEIIAAICVCLCILFIISLTLAAWIVHSDDGSHTRWMISSTLFGITWMLTPLTILLGTIGILQAGFIFLKAQRIIAAPATSGIV